MIDDDDGDVWTEKEEADNGHRIQDGHSKVGANWEGGRGSHSHRLSRLKHSSPNPPNNFNIMFKKKKSLDDVSSSWNSSLSRLDLRRE